MDVLWRNLLRFRGHLIENLLIGWKALPPEGYSGAVEKSEVSINYSTKVISLQILLYASVKKFFFIFII